MKGLELPMSEWRLNSVIGVGNGKVWAVMVPGVSAAVTGRGDRPTTSSPSVQIPAVSTRVLDPPFLTAGCTWFPQLPRLPYFVRVTQKALCLWCYYRGHKSGWGRGRLPGCDPPHVMGCPHVTVCAEHWVSRVLLSGSLLRHGQDIGHIQFPAPLPSKEGRRPANPLSTGWFLWAGQVLSPPIWRRHGLSINSGVSQRPCRE